MVIISFGSQVLQGVSCMKRANCTKWWGYNIITLQSIFMIIKQLGIKWCSFYVRYGPFEFINVFCVIKLMTIKEIEEVWKRYVTTRMMVVIMYKWKFNAFKKKQIFFKASLSIQFLDLIFLVLELLFGNISPENKDVWGVHSGSNDWK